jgi:hypothetical protein
MAGLLEASQTNEPKFMKSNIAITFAKHFMLCLPA